MNKGNKQIEILNINLEFIFLMRKGKENKPNKISLTNFGYFFNFLEFKQVKSK